MLPWIKDANIKDAIFVDPHIM